MIFPKSRWPATHKETKTLQRYSDYDGDYDFTEDSDNEFDDPDAELEMMCRRLSQSKKNARYSNDNRKGQFYSKNTIQEATDGDFGKRTGRISSSSTIGDLKV